MAPKQKHIFLLLLLSLIVSCSNSKNQDKSENFPSIKDVEQAVSEMHQPLPKTPDRKPLFHFNPAVVKVIVIVFLIVLVVIIVVFIIYSKPGKISLRNSTYTLYKKPPLSIHKNPHLEKPDHEYWYEQARATLLKNDVNTAVVMLHIATVHFLYQRLGLDYKKKYSNYELLTLNTEQDLKRKDFSFIAGLAQAYQFGDRAVSVQDAQLAFESIKGVLK